MIDWEQLEKDKAASTPGPWKIDSDTDVVGPSGYMVADLLVLDGNPSPVDIANARLIAAAPDLAALALAGRDAVEALETMRNEIMI